MPTAARAVDLPPPFSFTAGPLGTLQLSGGADAYAYALTGAGSATNPGLLDTTKSEGVQFLNGLIQLQKPDGLVRFTIEAGATNSLTLGTKPGSPSVQMYLHRTPAQRLRDTGAHIGPDYLGGSD